MEDRGLGSWIERWARVAPERAALIVSGRVLTYRALAARIRRLAWGLRALGVGRGDRVSWVGANDPAFLETLFACGKLGAVLSPTNHLREAAGISTILRDADPRAVVLERPRPDVEVPAGATRVLVHGEDDGALSYEAVLASGPDAPLVEDISLDDLCLLPFTSGTTGRPKGVMLTHGNLTWNAVNMVASADLREGDVSVAIAPFFRTGGIGVNVLPLLFKGGTVVIPDSTDPEVVLGALEEHRVTVGFANPHLLEGLRASPRWPTTDLSRVRYILTGGAPVPERLLRTFFDRGLPLVQGYGLSEFSPVVSLVDAPSAPKRIGSAGKPVLFAEVRVVRPDGTDCLPGEAGELLVRGPSAMIGYWRRPDATERALAGGWLHTGDAVRQDEEGYLWIVDRVGDAYTVGEHTVYPGDVERVLEEDPAVAEAGAVGVSGGGAALVVLRPGQSVSADALLALCRERLAPYQVPDRIVFVERIPRNSVGKLVRAEMRRLVEGGADVVRPDLPAPA